MSEAFTVGVEVCRHSKMTVGAGERDDVILAWLELADLARDCSP